MLIRQNNLFNLIFVLCCGVLLFCSNNVASNINNSQRFITSLKIYNATEYCFEIYYLNPFDIYKQPCELNEHSSVEIEANKNMIVQLLSKNYSRSIAVTFDLGNLNVKCLYIIEDEEEGIYALDELEWELFSAAKECLHVTSYAEVYTIVDDLFKEKSNFNKKGLFYYLTDILKSRIRSFFSSKIASQYNPLTSSVVVGNYVGEEELEYIKKRSAKGKKSLEVFLNRCLDNKDMPSIALILTGGGYRAMLGSLGTLTALEELGLLDSITHVSSLSGSAWLVMLWMTYGCSLAELKRILIPKLTGLFRNVNISNLKNALEYLLIKYSFDQPMTLVDLFGVVLANSLLEDFGEEKFFIQISQQKERLKDGAFPFPLYSLSSGSIIQRVSWWYEVNPLETSGYQLNMSIPTFSCGRRFDDGETKDFSPELSLPFFMGACGSGFTVKIYQLHDYLFSGLEHNAYQSDSVSRKICDTITRYILDKIGNKRLSCAKIKNFSFNMANSPIGNVKHLKLIDPGYLSNFPYLPVSGKKRGRRFDILIFADYSLEVNGSPEFAKVAEYAQEKNFPFPPINLKNIDERAVTVFKDEQNLDIPVVIYLPRTKDVFQWETLKNENHELFYRYNAYLEELDVENFMKSTGKTTNFYYTNFEAIQWCSLFEFNMLISKDKIADAINWVIDKKSKKGVLNE